MLKVCLIVDNEADFYYNIPSPYICKSWVRLIKWKLNKLRGILYRYPWPSRNGFKNLIKKFKQYNIPATFNTVGHLYLKKCQGWPHYNEEKPTVKWFYNFKKDWYYWDQEGDYKKFPGKYLGDIIEEEKRNRLFDFGLHAFSHEAYLLETKEFIEKSLSSGIQACADIGVRPVSYQGPWNMVEEETQPDKLIDCLIKKGIKIVAYSGKNNLDFQRKEFRIAPLFKKDKLNFVWISNYIEGTSPHSKVKEIINEISSNLYENKVYCLAMHDFTWKNMKNLDLILSRLVQLRKEKKIEIKNMKQLI